MDRSTAIATAIAGALLLAPATRAAGRTLAGTVSSRATPAAAGTGARPAPVQRAAPRYPRLAQFEAVQGDVNVCFTVTARGTVENPRVTSTPDSSIADIAIRRKIRQEFRTASLEAIRQWTFSPRHVDGRAVATPDVCQTLVFHLR